MSKWITLIAVAAMAIPLSPVVSEMSYGTDAAELFSLADGTRQAVILGSDKIGPGSRTDTSQSAGSRHFSPMAIRWSAAGSCLESSSDV